MHSIKVLGRAIDRLEDALHHPEVACSAFIQDAAIQRFKWAIELYWKVLKKILAYEKAEATSPRHTLSLSYQLHLIHHEAIWLAMLDDRNQTSHLYNQEEAYRVCERIKTYGPIMVETYETLQRVYQNVVT